MNRFFFLKYSRLIFLATLAILWSSAPCLWAGEQTSEDRRAMIREGLEMSSRPQPSSDLSTGQLWAGLGLLSALSFILVIDILMRRRIERALLEEKEWINLLLASTAEGVYGLDLNGSCTFCNPAALRLLGYKDESDLLGKKIHDLIHHTRPDGTPYPAEDCRVCLAFRQNVCVHVEDEVLWRTDGTSFPAEYRAQPIRRRDEPIGAVVTFLDVSERKEAEKKRQEALRELDAFAYTVCHDLRTPLSVIIGYADMLQEEFQSFSEESVREMLADIERQGERMAAIMEDLLALAQVGSLPKPLAEVDADEVLEETLGELRSQLVVAGLTVQKSLLPPAWVPRTYLFQIFSNLVGNAARYAGPEGGPIEVGGESRAGRVLYYVRDHGPGIPAEEREKVFDAFYRGTTGKGKSGTGVGLATVRKIARFFAGEATVEETPGGGCTIWVDLTNTP